MAEALLDTVLGRLGTEETPAYEILEKFVGKDLEYREYEPLWECTKEAAEKQKKKAKNTLKAISLLLRIVSPNLIAKNQEPMLSAVITRLSFPIWAVIPSMDLRLTAKI